ncbi:hypothetical protein [Aeromonas veronii]|uniref:hypothetical protein n=1 Tax=Aeromonas veronii TaxID=654 RepID=UPI00059B9476|nr:hypothetical protein [Aeromonas veronii]
MMIFLNKIRKIKNITKMATGRVALRHANNDNFLLASLILNIEYIFKLLIATVTIYLIFFTNVRPKNAPDWIVLLEMFFTLILCIVVFYTRRERLICRAKIKAIQESRIKASRRNDNNMTSSRD